MLFVGGQKKWQHTGKDAAFLMKFMPTEEKLKAVQLLIDHGIDVNWLNSRFETPLMMALNQIEIEVAELLIDNGGIVYQPPKRPKEQNTEEENKE